MRNTEFRCDPLSLRRSEGFCGDLTSQKTCDDVQSLENWGSQLSSKSLLRSICISYTEMPPSSSLSPHHPAGIINLMLIKSQRATELESYWSVSLNKLIQKQKQAETRGETEIEETEGDRETEGEQNSLFFLNFLMSSAVSVFLPPSLPSLSLLSLPSLHLSPSLPLYRVSLFPHFWSIFYALLHYSLLPFLVHYLLPSFTNTL